MTKCERERVIMKGLSKFLRMKIRRVETEPLKCEEGKWGGGSHLVHLPIK